MFSLCLGYALSRGPHCCPNNPSLVCATEHFFCARAFIHIKLHFSASDMNSNILVCLLVYILCGPSTPRCCALHSPRKIDQEILALRECFLADMSAIRGGGCRPPLPLKKSRCKKFSACPEKFFLLKAFFCNVNLCFCSQDYHIHK